jgi:hypothetical protein
MSVDYEGELQYELWPLDKAVLLLCGINPNSKRASLLKESFETDTAPRGERGREVCTTYHRALSAIRAGVLVCENGEVRPLDFLRWARRRHFPLPEELATLLTSRDRKTQAEKPLSIMTNNPLS